MSDRTYISGENLLDTIGITGYPELSIDDAYDSNRQLKPPTGERGRRSKAAVEHLETFDASGDMDDYIFTAGYDDDR
ncbi:hypothetical protein AB1L42_04355 [Thalassoglobus sp. JC818]|uniref:hypothetical protein n=1 Tax=Thalassoglobus sp. JC818 TaxID=3232136 RepID=UPI0034597522